MRPLLYDLAPARAVASLIPGRLLFRAMLVRTPVHPAHVDPQNPAHELGQPAWRGPLQRPQPLFLPHRQCRRGARDDDCDDHPHGDECGTDDDDSDQYPDGCHDGSPLSSAQRLTSDLRSRRFAPFRVAGHRRRREASENCPQVLAHPSAGTARLSPMNPAVQAIPTSGISPMLTSLRPDGNGITPTSWLSCMVGMSLVSQTVGAVGIYGRLSGG